MPGKIDGGWNIILLRQMRHDIARRTYQPSLVRKSSHDMICHSAARRRARHRHQTIITARRATEIYMLFYLHHAHAWTLLG